MDQALIPINEIVKKGWVIYKENWQKFILPMALLLPGYLFVFTLAVLQDFLTNRLPFYLIIVLLIMVAVIVLFLILWAYLIITKTLYAIIKGASYNGKEIREKCKHLVAPYLWVNMLSGLVMFLGFILLIIPFLFFMVWYNFAPLVTALEEKNNRGVEALNISKKLTKGRAWDVFGRMLIPALFIQLVIYLILFLFAVILMIAGLSFAYAYLVAYIVFIVTSFALIPLFLAFEIILYSNLKDTRKI